MILILFLWTHQEVDLMIQQELLKTHKILRFALFDQFAYSEHIECGVILEKNANTI